MIPPTNKAAPLSRVDSSGSCLFNAANHDRQTQLKILLAEDNSVNQEVTLRQLKNLGYITDVVGNGQQAVEAITQIDYDLILMDCQMPILDGYGAARAIRALEDTTLKHRSRRAVIIAMTANPLWQDQNKAFAAGMDDYLSKPVHKEVLATMLERWSQTLSVGQSTLDSPQPTDSVPSSNQTSPDLHIDWDHLHQLSDNSPEFERELLQLFIEDSNAHLGALKQAIATHDFQQLEQEAHHIKGASANVGMRSMEMAASQLELQARQHDITMAPGFLSQLERCLEHVQAFVAAR